MLPQIAGLTAAFALIAYNASGCGGGAAHATSGSCSATTPSVSSTGDMHHGKRSITVPVNICPAGKTVYSFIITKRFPSLPAGMLYPKASYTSQVKITLYYPKNATEAVFAVSGPNQDCGTYWKRLSRQGARIFLGDGLGDKCATIGKIPLRRSVP